MPTFDERSTALRRCIASRGRYSAADNDKIIYPARWGVYERSTEAQRRFGFFFATCRFSSLGSWTPLARHPPKLGLHSNASRSGCDDVGYRNLFFPFSAIPFVPSVPLYLTYTKLFCKRPSSDSTRNAYTFNRTFSYTDHYKPPKKKKQKRKKNIEPF